MIRRHPEPNQGGPSAASEVYRDRIYYLYSKYHRDCVRVVIHQDPVSYTHLRAHETRHDLVCRLLLEKKKSREIKIKIAFFCNLEDQAVITAKDVESIYEVPMTFAREGVDSVLLRYLGID